MGQRGQSDDLLFVVVGSSRLLAIGVTELMQGDGEGR